MSDYDSVVLGPAPLELRHEQVGGPLGSLIHMLGQP